MSKLSNEFITLAETYPFPEALKLIDSKDATEHQDLRAIKNVYILFVKIICEYDVYNSTYNSTNSYNMDLM